MHISTKKWLFTKVSSLILIPLMCWFIINLANIYDNDYQKVVEFFSSQPSKKFYSLYLLFLLTFFQL